MITSLFKNTGLSYIVVLGIGSLLWGIEIYTTNVEEFTLVQIGNHNLSLNRIVALVLSYLITIISGLYIDYRLQNYLFGYENSHLFFLFYVLFISTGLHSDLILQHSILSFTILVFTTILINLIEKPNKENSTFNASLLIGILALHNFNFSLLIIFVIIALSTLKSINGKDIGLILLGLILPVFYIVIFTLLTENLEHFSTILTVNLDFPSINWKKALLLILVITLSIMGRSLFIKNRFGVELSIYKLTDLLALCLYFLLLISILSLFLFQMDYAIAILAIPTSAFLVKYFINSSYRFKELALISLIFILIIS